MKTKSKPKAKAKPKKRPESERNGADAEVLTPAEAAALLKVPLDGLLRDAAAGWVPGKQIAGEWRFSRKMLFRWLRSAPAAKPTIPPFEETPEEFAAFLAHIEAARDEVDRVTGSGKYAPE